MPNENTASLRLWCEACICNLTGMPIDFEPADSLRPGGAYAEWTRPSNWVRTPLYFEIFQFNPANRGNWKVSLIGEKSGNPFRLSQLRAAAKFLSTEFRWTLPKGAGDEFDGDSAAVFLKSWKFAEFANQEAHVAHAEKCMREVLDHHGWTNVFAVV